MHVKINFMNLKDHHVFLFFQIIFVKCNLEAVYVFRQVLFPLLLQSIQYTVGHVESYNLYEWRHV